MENLNSQKNKPEIIEGGFAVDDRGQLTFVNDFSFSDVKRFYMVENFSKDTIRAFHGHKNEAKYAFVVSGSAIVVAVEMDNTENPSKNNEIHRHVLSSRKPKIFYIPAGYTNGFKSLENDTKIIFFSTTTLEGSQKDDHRLPADYWGGEIWEIENR